MKTIAVVCFVLVAVMATNVASVPVFEDQQFKELSRLSEQETPVEEHGMRFRRATCDLLSFSSKWITVNDSACAAHCIGMLKGYKGGRCKSGVCHCRR